MRSLPSAIEPTISQSEINEPFYIIGELPLTLYTSNAGAKTVDLDGRLILKWLPTPRIFIESEFQHGLPHLPQISVAVSKNSELKYASYQLHLFRGKSVAYF